MTYPAIPITYGDEAQHRRIIAEKANQLNQGKFNCFIELTLTHDVGTTTLTDARISAFSVLSFMPTTANAAAEIPTLYVDEATMQTGSAIISHSNAATTDRSFRVGIFG